MNVTSKYPCQSSAFVLAVLLLFFGMTAIAFTAPARTDFLMPNGSGSALADGDYVAVPLNTVYEFFIEVPSGLSRFRVLLYDADVGRNNDTTYDFRAGSWDTSCRYTLYDPSGTQRATFLGDAANGNNNSWQTLFNQTSGTIANGHWRLVADMSSTVTSGDETNGFRITADDGNSGSGGTEIPIYAYTFLPSGNIGSGSRTFRAYPWVTSGCTVDFNDFDGDSNVQISYASRTGAASGSYTGSGASTWRNEAVAFESDEAYSIESGIWTANQVVSGNNIVTFYAGNSNASNPPPSGQPETDTFRIYFPTDDGSVPVKPYLTQHLNFVSGSNPAQVGNDTYVSVIVEFHNPTAHNIGSVSSNITAYVPGGEVTYRGSAYAAVTQGSISGQPSAGGSGTVTWNPGTISAGATAVLSYQIRIRPTSAGTIDVTGTPSGNGTQATYLDETQNSSQSRATYTYGGLCGLGVTTGSGNEIPTWAGISRFEACREESRATVEWHTNAEIGVVGFNLWRKNPRTNEFIRINPELLTALPNAPGGGVYRWVDQDDVYNEPQIYRLEEIDARGRSVTYGPFTINFNAVSWSDTRGSEVRHGRQLPSQIDGYSRFERERSPLEDQRLRERAAERQRSALQGRWSNDRLRITVRGKGLFFVSAAQVAAGLGVSKSQAQSLISRYNLQLTGMGADIPWLAENAGGGLYFYNEGKETVFFDKNVYFLERGRGLAMESIAAGSATPADPGLTYQETRHFEVNQYAATALFRNATDDIWLWEYIAAGNGAKDFAVQVPGCAGSGNAVLTIALQGATDSGAGRDHHAVVSINGRQVGDSTWAGTEAHVFEAAFDASWLQEGTNTITIAGVLDTGAPYSSFYVESFDLRYPRLYAAENNTLICRSEDHYIITVSGITEPKVLVLDVTQPGQPVHLSNVVPDFMGQVNFASHSADREYVVSGLNAVQPPLDVRGSRSPADRRRILSVDHIVIAPREFVDTAGELSDFRQSRGLQSIVVPLEEIYDTCNHGVPNPFAIREFLSDAYGKGRNGRLKYVVLAGKGTFDYNDYRGFGDNLVPVILSGTAHGLFAADGIFGDVRGNDGLPEIAVGRLPAVTNAELKAMIDKIKTYERGQGEWTGRSLFIADNNDDGGDFTGASDRLDARAKGMRTQKIYHAGSVAETRAAITSAWNAGVALVNYCGHAGLRNFGQENFFNNDDAAGLRNPERLPLSLLLSCIAGRFEMPGFTSLAEALLLNPDGGMAGGLAPSGLAMNSDSLQFGELFYNAVFQGLEDSVGKALLSAMQSYRQKGGDAYLLRVYNWLGDPATAFK